MFNIAEINDQIKQYEERIESGNVFKPDFCEVCKRRSKLQWHGEYQRSLILPGADQNNSDKEDSRIITIKRLFCTICEHTFSLLPTFVAKFHRYAKVFIEMVLKELKAQSYEKVANLIMESCGRYISTLTLYFWKKKFVNDLS
jgi:hypothetical protein